MRESILKSSMLCAALILSVGDRQIGPGPRAPEGDGSADPARRSGDQDDLVVQHSAASPPDTAGCNFLTANISVV